MIKIILFAIVFVLASATPQSLLAETHFCKLEKGQTYDTPVIFYSKGIETFDDKTAGPFTSFSSDFGGTIKVPPIITEPEVKVIAEEDKVAFTASYAKKTPGAVVEIKTDDRNGGAPRPKTEPPAASEQASSGQASSSQASDIRRLTEGPTDVHVPGKYLEIGANSGIVVTMNHPVDYFGMYISNLIARQTTSLKVTLFKDDDSLKIFTEKDFINPTLGAEYHLNPHDDKDSRMGHFVFVGFGSYKEAGRFNKITIESTGDPIYTDNHTIGFRYPKEAFQIAACPAPPPRDPHQPPPVAPF